MIPDPSGGSFRTVEFEPTVRMSSYLVAAVVGKMSMLESQLTSGSDTVKVRPALRVTPRTLAWPVTGGEQLVRQRGHSWTLTRRRLV